MVTRLTRKNPIDVIKENVVDAKSSTTYSRPIGWKGRDLTLQNIARYLYAAGELEGGQKRTTDPI